MKTHKRIAACIGVSITISTSVFASSELTAQELVERITQQTGARIAGPTVDTFKAGDPATPVRGIAVAMMGTHHVLQQAVAAGANFIITHEPVFYGHLDVTTELEEAGDTVLAAKQEFIRNHGLVIWRFHDYQHRMKPDMVVQGVTKALGWKTYQTAPGERTYVLPEPVTVARFASDIRERLGIRTLRVVGDPAMTFTKFGFGPGFGGFAKNRQILHRDEVEVLVIGEAHEWEGDTSNLWSGIKFMTQPA